jgi:hypothetical protein
VPSTPTEGSGRVHSTPIGEATPSSSASTPKARRSRRSESLSGASLLGAHDGSRPPIRKSSTNVGWNFGDSPSTGNESPAATPTAKKRHSLGASLDIPLPPVAETLVVKKNPDVWISRDLERALGLAPPADTPKDADVLAIAKDWNRNQLRAMRIAAGMDPDKPSTSSSKKTVKDASKRSGPDVSGDESTDETTLKALVDLAYIWNKFQDHDAIDAFCWSGVPLNIKKLTLIMCHEATEDDLKNKVAVEEDAIVPAAALQWLTKFCELEELNLIGNCVPTTLTSIWS